MTEEYRDDIDPQELSIGVIVTCYNHGQFLRESVESILKQTHQNFQVVIVNDGSTDDTDDVAQSLLATGDDRIGYMSFSENQGKWLRLNQVIEKLDTVFITSQDADDVSMPDRLERQLQCLLETKTLHNLCGFYSCENDDDVNTHRLRRQEGDLAILQPDIVVRNAIAGYSHSGVNHYTGGGMFPTAGASAMFHRRIWELGTRFNPPSMGLRVLNSEDSDFNFRTTINTARTSVLLERLYCYRRNTSTNDQRK